MPNRQYSSSGAPPMPPTKAIAILTKLLADAEGLKGEPFGSSKRDAWTNTAQGALERSFAQGSSILNNFEASQAIAFGTGDSEETLRRIANETLTSEVAVLHSAIEQLGWESTEDDLGTTLPPLEGQEAGVEIGGPVISTAGPRMTRHAALVLNVLIASPSDVAEERQVVTEVINEWNAIDSQRSSVMLRPVRWESHSYPASGARPQAIVNKQIVDSADILVGIFGYKLGTSTGAAQSGTIEEIEEFRRAGKYIALYFSTADVPRGADRDQLTGLEAYKNERKKDTLYFEFERSDTLRDHLTRHLPNIVQDVVLALNLSNPSQGPGQDQASQETGANSATDKAAIGRSTLLADIISELEDNLDRASRPRTGDTYRRPSNHTWIQNRNKIVLPSAIRLQVNNIYDQIGSWVDVVSSGLNPNMGSIQLNLVVSGLTSSLPPVIHQLRKLLPPNVGP